VVFDPLDLHAVCRSWALAYHA